MAAAIEKWLYELDVHQMRAAKIGIIENENVAFAERLCALDHRLGRELHRADKYRQAELALRDQLAGIPAVNSVGAVEPSAMTGLNAPARTPDPSRCRLL